MSRKMFWLYLLAGGFLLLLGIGKLYQQGDWVLLIIGSLIIAFTISSRYKKR